MSEILKKRGRPKGAKGDADDELDILIQRRRETQEQAQREAANNRARYALRKHNQRTQNRLAWISHHDQLGRQHQHLADEHFQQAAQLKREGCLWE